MSTFTITRDHIKLLRNMYVGWDDCEFGAPAIDCKRPYGNSFVEGDIAKILEWDILEDGLTDYQYEIASKLHSETQEVLQIILSDLSTDYVGTYERRNSYVNKWVRIQ